MKRARLGVILVLLAAASAWAQAPAEPADPQAAVKRRLEGYLRYLYAWDDNVQVKVGQLLESSIPGVYSTVVDATQGENRFRQVFLVTPDGRFVIRGEVLDTSIDPYASARLGISLTNQPSKGPAEALVTIVEYGDFQCPTCKEMYPVLKELLAQRKDVRVVYKDLPLVAKHDWAMAAAVAGQCAYRQSNDAFWKLHDYFFENQSQLNAQNLEQKLDAFATRAGLDAAAFSACRQQKLTQHRVEAALEEAAALGLANTPTLLINGRPLVGAQPRQIIDRLIDFELKLQTELNQQGSAKP
ncbi:MAG TPA: thioredoxin domain-containing protein [Candidatus Xenobia bacterium]|nr:thioredoxin domain-containing protein [Candidatus Xenobia bacterium]